MVCWPLQNFVSSQKDKREKEWDPVHKKTLSDVMLSASKGGKSDSGNTVSQNIITNFSLELPLVSILRLILFLSFSRIDKVLRCIEKLLSFN